MKITQHLGSIFVSSLISLLGFGTVAGAFAQEAHPDTTNLSAKEILDKVQRTYASLSTYRDTGWTVQGPTGHAWTNTFTEVLGTRTRYCIEVITAAHPYSQTNNFWCDGSENLSQMGGPMIFHSGELSGNLVGASGETAIPAVYFLLSWGNMFTPFKLGPDSELIRKPDETVGDESCYVVARTTRANPATLWVGKGTFLIHRCELYGRIETHENISTNELFNAKDYIPANLRK